MIPSHHQWALEQLTTLNVPVTRLVTDSRSIQSGDTFVAYPGEKSDGRQFIAPAIAKGANAVIYEKLLSGHSWEAQHFVWNDAWQVPNLAVADLRHKAGWLADAVYGAPSEKLWVVGITGTNGKTSTSHWIAHALNEAGKQCALIGTMGNGFVDALQASANTTPDAIRVHGLLADFLHDGAEAVAMEVSSHALSQGRVNAVHFDVAMLTNLSRDHLDYHGDIQHYADTKRKLFDWQQLGFVVLNLDDAFGVELAEQLSLQEGRRWVPGGFAATLPQQGSDAEVIGYGLSDTALQLAERMGLRMVYGNLQEMTGQGLRLAVHSSWGSVELDSALVGRFNAANLLGALAVLLVSGITLSDAADSLSRAQPVAGRMQRLGSVQQPTVIVDYAHTPDALEKVLQTLREVSAIAGGKVLCVFGCGGDRDRGKRAMMGLVAEKFSDFCIVTSDNPRSEDPREIIAEIVSGMNENNHEIIIDRAAAIQSAIRHAQQSDTVLIAGKGHEDYQEINGVKHPFNDVMVAQQALQSCHAVQQSQSKLRGWTMMLLSQAAEATGGKLLGTDVRFNAVSSDSRKIVQGDLFIALRGEHFDGYNFVATAAQAGAIAALVNADSYERKGTGGKKRGTGLAPGMPLLLVEDTRLALGRLAGWWRRQFSIPLVAITGSNGKTTVKEMLASILREAAGSADAVLATQGNLNNDVGMPLTLLQLNPTHRYAVIEMGMNHSGEIEYLTRIARPDVALINNASGAHLEGLGSEEAVARAKGEIFSGLKHRGTAVINADDANAPLWRSLAGVNPLLEFGLNPEADVCGTWQSHGYGLRLDVTAPQGIFTADLKIPGEHNARNALAATAAAIVLNISLEAITVGLEKFSGVAGRLQRMGALHGATLIDDTYNANPASMRAAISVLAQSSGKHILVLGDMGELGDKAATFHAEIGSEARRAGIEKLYALGTLSGNTVREFGSGARHFEHIEDLQAALEKELDAKTTVLVKGSRFMKMERVVQFCCAGH